MKRKQMQLADSRLVLSSGAKLHRCIHRFSRSTNVIGFFLAGSVRGFFVTHMGSSRGNTIASLITLLSVSALSLVATHLPSSCTYAVG